MKIWTISDLHIDFVIPELFEHPAHDLIVMAGDLSDGDFDPVPFLLGEFTDDERSKLIFVAGNHEAYNVGLDAIPGHLKRLREETGIITLDRETVEIDGQRILGCTMWTPLHPSLDTLGGDLSAIPGFSGGAWRAAHERDRIWLEETVREGDIVVTHHSPSWSGLDGSMQQNPRLMGMSSGYFADMTDLIEQRSPALWVHGHTHVTLEYAVGQTKVVSNAAGRGRAMMFEPGYVVELDDLAPRLRSGRHG